MTRQYNEQYQCASCGCTTTTETAFGRWIRDNKRLDSGDGFTCYDVDYIVHKYKTITQKQEQRDYQLLMLVEVKTRNSDLKTSQRDTFYILNQIIENRRPNRNIQSGGAQHNNRHRQSYGPLKVYSIANQKYVQVRSYGLYTLRFSGTEPNDSESIFWNKKKIDVMTLEQLLNFDIEPDNFTPIDEALRNRHRQKQKTRTFFDSESN